MVMETGTVAPAVSATESLSKLALAAAALQLTFPVGSHVQLWGKWATPRATIPLKVLLAVTFKWYVTEPPGATVWLSSAAVMVKVGLILGSALGTPGAGQNVMI